jgi:hypothetical protein
MSDTLTIQVQDASAATAQAQFIIPVSDPGAITTTSPLPGASQGSAYSTPFAATGGTPPYNWLVMGSTGANVWVFSGANLIGTPGAAETDTISVLVTDAVGVPNAGLFNLTVAASPQAATPTFSPVAGSYGSAQNVTISCLTPSSTIYYTTNGSTPTTGSTVYSSSVNVAITETLKAIATASGYLQSAVGSAGYTISGGGTFDYYISPTGDDNNVGSLASPWSVTALKSKWTTYTGKKVGCLPGTYTHGTVGGVQTTLYSLCNSLGNTTNQMAIPINGGTAGTPTLIQSTVARGAIFDASNPVGGALPTNECPLFGQGLYGSTVPHPGNIIIDGICVRKVYQTGISFFPTAATTEGAGPTGIEIRNCEIAHISGTDNDNVAGIYLQGCNAAWVHNCVIHDVQGAAANQDDVAGIYSYYCRSNIYEYNTIYDCNNAIYEKYFPNGNHTWRYNYFEGNGQYPQNCVHGGSGGMVNGDVQSIYNNIMLAPQTGIMDASLGGAPAEGSAQGGGSQQSLSFHNNPCLFKGAASGGNVVGSGITYPAIGSQSPLAIPATVTQYNNVFYNISANIQYLGVWTYPTGSISLSDYNLVGTLAGSSNTLGMSPLSSLLAGTLYTLANWRSNFGFDAHSAALNPTFVTPTYIDTTYSNPSGYAQGFNPAGWKLTGGTAGSASGSNPGHVGGVSGGAAIDMGAWGGTDVNTGNPVAQLGATWTATI